jgi:hypothetical protein
LRSTVVQSQPDFGCDSADVVNSNNPREADCGVSRPLPACTSLSSGEQPEFFQIAEDVESLALSPTSANSQALAAAGRNIEGQPMAASLAPMQASPANCATAPASSSILDQLQALAARYQRAGETQLKLRIEDNSGRPIVLQINPRINRVQMVLRAEDKELLADLRREVGGLVHRLEASGINAGVTVVCRTPQVDDQKLTNPSPQEQSHGEENSARNGSRGDGRDDEQSPPAPRIPKPGSSFELQA